jgi:sugar transferase (PEP-CTERM system associated)
MFKICGVYIPVKSAILGITETVLIVASVWFAAWVRVGRADLLVENLNKGYPAGVKLAVVVGVCVLCFYYNDLYNLQIVSRRSELLVRLLQALGAASLILALLYYAAPDLMFGRGISALTAVIAGLALVAWRLVVDATGGFFRPQERLLVAGTGPSGIRLVRELIEHPELNIKVLGFLDERGENLGKRLVNPGVIGGVTQLDDIVRREQVQRVVLSFAERRGQMPVQHLLHLKFAGVTVEDAHSMYEKLAGRIMLERLTPSWLFLADGFRKSSWQLLLKRLADIGMSAAALIILSPLSLIISLAVFIETGRPILFCQKRVGLNGHEFQMLKFRSMYQDAEKHGAAWASQTDRRITRVGKFLRRYRLDEIPQFVNVLWGEMSLVGPRPEQPAFVEQLEKEIPYYGQRHTVRPGITGWAQIKYKYGASSEDAKNKLEFELFYIKHMSIWLDFLIMVRTVQVVLFGQGAI